MNPTRYLGMFLISLFAQHANAVPVPASFTYVLQADSLAKTKAAAVRQIEASGRDWVILDSDFESGVPWERADLDSIRGSHPDRKVLAYLSVGEAEDYRPYWCKEWVKNGRLTAAAPGWLGKENAEWHGNFGVNYWDAAWQKLILAEVDDAMRRGFDGVYLDIVDGFEGFEQEGSDFVDNRHNPKTKQSFRRDMVDWVRTIAARARAKHPDALVVPQNGSQLLENADFLSDISAIGIEDLFTNGNKLQPRSHSDDILNSLKKVAAAQKPILLIEYPGSAERQETSKRLARLNRMIWLITDRQLKTPGVSGK